MVGVEHVVINEPDPDARWLGTGHLHQDQGEIVADLWAMNRLYTPRKGDVVQIDETLHRIGHVIDRRQFVLEPT